MLQIYLKYIATSLQRRNYCEVMLKHEVFFFNWEKRSIMKTGANQLERKS